MASMAVLNGKYVSVEKAKDLYNIQKHAIGATATKKSQASKSRTHNPVGFLHFLLLDKPNEQRQR